MPHVIEPAAGVDRAALAFLVDAYDEEVVAERERTVLRLHPRIAPVKAAVLPLIGKDAGMVEQGAGALRGAAARRCRSSTTTAAAIGKRYRRQDEIGTPWALTIDDQTLEDDTVTIRDRDSLAQERIPIAGRASTCRTGLRSRGARRRAASSHASRARAQPEAAVSTRTRR